MKRSFKNTLFNKQNKTKQKNMIWGKFTFCVLFAKKKTNSQNINGNKSPREKIIFTALYLLLLV